MSFIGSYRWVSKYLSSKTLSEEMERISLRNRVSREAYVRKIYVVVRRSTVAVRGRPTKSFVNGNYIYVKNVAQWLQLIAVVTDSSRKEI